MSAFADVELTAAGEPQADTFATYLARYHVARKGFRYGCVPEAAELAAHCDIVLTRYDGYGLAILCVVDGEARPDAKFGLTVSEAERIGRACLGRTGRIHGQKMPMSIQVFEVGPGWDSPARRLCLQAFRRRVKTILVATIVDTAALTVWSNMPFRGLLAGRPAIERLLRQPRLAVEDLRPPEPVAIPAPRWPILTGTILAVLIAVFAAEIGSGTEPWTGALEPSIGTLVDFGALNRFLVLEFGQWYRLLSAPFLHADLFHLMLNGLALFLGGRVLETVVGRSWFAAVFGAGAVCGSLVSLAVNPENVVAVGASGAITAVFAALFACAYHFPVGRVRTQLQISAVQVLIPALLPLLPALGGGEVDYGAHFGGALAGAAIGLALLRLWPSTEARPRGQRGAAALAIAWLLASLYALLAVVQWLFGGD